MRIVGGALSGRRFRGPSGDRTRPTSERVREAIASAIESRGGFAGMRVLDLFAGTGAMAFEALSRGASEAVLVDRDSKAVRALATSAAELGLADRCRAIASDLFTAAGVDRISGGPFDRVFVDPPYSEIDSVPELIDRLRERSILAPRCILAVEHGKRHAPAVPDGLTVLSHPRYGDTAVLLFEVNA